MNTFLEVIAGIPGVIRCRFDAPENSVAIGHADPVIQFLKLGHSGLADFATPFKVIVGQKDLTNIELYHGLVQDVVVFPGESLACRIVFLCTIVVAVIC